MGFWSKIGLASHKELQEIKKECTMQQTFFKEEIRELFEEQNTVQEKTIDALKYTFEQSLDRLAVKDKERTEQLAKQASDLDDKICRQFSELIEQGEGVSSKIEMLQEIAKIHWASNLIDYVDELLEELETKQDNNEESIHPLTYNFGEISGLFKFIYEKTRSAGLYIGWRNTKQTVQIFLKEEDSENSQNQIGAIQYEGSNNFSEKLPHTISWRFIVPNMPKKLVQDISKILSNEQASILLSTQKDHIVFKFQQDTPETRIKIEKITAALRKSMLLAK